MWGEQDGGEGGVGTVVDYDTMEKPDSCTDLGRGVVVQWDIGKRSNYRSAIQGKYDLRIWDNGPLGE